MRVSYYRRDDTPRQRTVPRNETGIYLYVHAHRWRETGYYKWPNGDVVPTFRCSICGDVICTDAREEKP